MRFEFSPEDEAFRLEVRAFFREHLPRDMARRFYIGGHPPERDDVRRFQKLMHAKGWGAPHWPVEWGGTGWSPLRKHLFMEELYNADGLDGSWQSLYMCGPVLIAFGSEAQKRRFLPPMISGDEFWAQGFSEPNAGSDLAHLRTQAVLDGDHWVVNGQKIWTSGAQFAQFGILIARTDPDVAKHKGITYFVCPMDLPGIEIRPIRTMTGVPSFNEVFFTDVRIPAANVVGDVHDGWRLAKVTLGNERVSLSSGGVLWGSGPTATRRCRRRPRWRPGCVRP